MYSVITEIENTHVSNINETTIKNKKRKNKKPNLNAAYDTNNKSAQHMCT